MDASRNVEICVVFPFWSQSDAMNWDSNYSYLRVVLPRLVDVLPDWLWFVMWPMKSYGADVWRWYGDSFFDDRRIIRWPWPYDTAMRSSVMGFDPMKFKELEDRVGPTIYWLHQVESGTYLYGGYRFSFNVSSRPTIVAQHHYIIHRSLPYTYAGMFPRLWMQVGGSLVADLVVVNSVHTQRMLEESFGELLNGETMAQLREKTRVLRFGLIDDEPDIPISREVQSPVIVYNHRFEAYKQPKITAEVLQSLRDAGHKFEVWVTQYVGQNASEFIVDRVVGHPIRAEYLKRIAVPAINTINSTHETFCISILDSMALGHLIVAPRAVTFPELLPEGYPYLFKSPDEQREMLDHILSTWPTEWEKHHTALREHARREFSLQRYVATYAEWLTEQAQKWRKSTPKIQTRVGIDSLVNAMPPGKYKVNDVARKIRAALALQNQAMPIRRVIREMSLRGCTVEWDPTEKTTCIIKREQNGLLHAEQTL